MRLIQWLMAKLQPQSPGKQIDGPTMKEYYQSLDDAFTAGYEAGRLNKEIHEARAWIAQHVGE